MSTAFQHAFNDILTNLWRCFNYVSTTLQWNLNDVAHYRFLTSNEGNHVSENSTTFCWYPTIFLSFVWQSSEKISELKHVNTQWLTLYKMIEYKNKHLIIHGPFHLLLPQNSRLSNISPSYFSYYFVQLEYRPT